MSIKMLKLIPVLFVLIALFVVPVSIYSSSNNGNGTSPSSDNTGWGIAETNKKCKGETKFEIKPKCKEIEKMSDCSITTMVYAIVSETEGCQTTGIGYLCYEKNKFYSIGTLGCKVTITTSEDFEGEVTPIYKCEPDTDDADFEQKKAPVCKDRYILN